MAESKHTPGPWRWRDIGGYWKLEADNGGCVIDDGSAAGEYSPTIYVNAPENQPDFANARLIAAAPELLEALKLLLSGAECEVRKGLVNPQINGGLVLARAAIAKAEGSDNG